MVKTENQKKLLKILNEIFQLDQSDLDFGIYRIMNTKSQEINDFLDKDLLSSVASAFSSNDNSAVQKELDELIKTLTNAGMNADDSPKVQELKDILSSSTTSSNLENEVFSHLANFFKRYYKDGDFVSLRRYKKDTYAIPYEGEEVKLHWANSDQYYIKIGEYFRDYTFRVNDKIIHLKLSDAQTESNNNKATSDKERRFVILEDNPCEIIEDELYINFEYKAIGKENQEKLNEKSIAKALETIEELAFKNALNTLAPTQKNKTRTILEKHLKSYTSRNSFDYFIHKDLGGFLGRELDFYIKNEMLFLDDIMDSPIKDVSCDMSPAFIKGVTENLPDAKITFDKFHILKIINEAVDKVRKEEVSTNKLLKGTKYIWLKNYNNLTAKQKEELESLTLSKMNIKTLRAYNIRQSFQEIYLAKTEDEFITYLNKWYFWATHSRLNPIIKAAKTIKRHWDGVVQWYKSKINNGILEGLNSVIQAAKSKARGYKTFRNYKIIVYLLTGKLDFALVNPRFKEI